MQVHAPEDKEQIDDDKSGELERETEEFRHHHRDRRYQAREVNLSEQVRIGLESIRDSREALGEILPEAYTGEVENRLRDIIRRDIGNASEHDHVHHHREQRRDEIPAHTKNGLLVLHRDVTLDEQPDEVAFTPQFYQPQTSLMRGWGYNCGVIFIVLFQN